MAIPHIEGIMILASYINTFTGIATCPEGLHIWTPIAQPRNAFMLCYWTTLDRFLICWIFVSNIIKFQMLRFFFFHQCSMVILLSLHPGRKHCTREPQHRLLGGSSTQLQSSVRKSYFLQLVWHQITCSCWLWWLWCPVWGCCLRSAQETCASLFGTY